MLQPCSSISKIELNVRWRITEKESCKFGACTWKMLRSEVKSAPLKKILFHNPKRLGQLQAGAKVRSAASEPEARNNIRLRFRLF